MIRKFISRVFGHKTPGVAGEPAIIGVARHGIRREAISNGSRRTEAKAQASRENGRRGGRPRKAEAA